MKLTLVLTGELEKPSDLEEFEKFMKNAIRMNLLSFGVVNPDTVRGVKLKADFNPET